jgi:glycosyltransferase involved in cell wall biosynthesis
MGEAVSVIIPARNETYLERTIRNVLDNARGDVEVLIVLDGWAPDPRIDVGDKRATFYHFEESTGQRQAINYAARQARGKYMMKLDAHCAVDEGFDLKLAADCERDWTVIPRMYNLDVTTWKPKLHKRTDYMYIGLRPDGELRTEYYGGQEYRRLHRNPSPIDDTMSCMGPGFFMRLDRFWELGGCDEVHGGWGQQGIEVACKAWLSGGRLIVNKKTWFAHWFRGGGGPGFPYKISGKSVAEARRYSKDLWLNDKWPLAKRKFSWLLEKFNPPGWKETMPPSNESAQSPAPLPSPQIVSPSMVPALDRNGMYRRIRRRFDVLTRDDFSPIGTHEGTRENLGDLFEDFGYAVGAEIGVCRGYFSDQILRRTSKVHLHSVDPWVPYHDSKYGDEGQGRNERMARAKLKPWIEAGRCTIHKDFSLKAVDTFQDESLDFVFIDGNHVFDHAVQDIIRWVPKVRIGGMVGVHDYFPMRRGGVIEAVDAYTRCHMIHPWFVIREAIPTAFWIKEHR